MVAAHSSDLRGRIVHYYNYQGGTVREVANIFNVSPGFVHVTLLIYTGSMVRPQIHTPNQDVVTES